MSRTITDHGCLNSDGTLGGENEIKKRNKFFEICFKKMEIDKAKSNYDNITIKATLSRLTKTRQRTAEVSIDKKELGNCGLSDAAIAVVATVTILFILAGLAAYFSYRKYQDMKMNKEIVIDNRLYGLAEYIYDTEISEKNPSYETEQSAAKWLRNVMISMDKKKGKC